MQVPNTTPVTTQLWVLPSAVRHWCVPDAE